jgi:hypothetical protein
MSRLADLTQPYIRKVIESTQTVQADALVSTSRKPKSMAPSPALPVTILVTSPTIDSYLDRKYPDENIRYSHSVQLIDIKELYLTCGLTNREPELPHRQEFKKVFKEAPHPLPQTKQANIVEHNKSLPLQKVASKVMTGVRLMKVFKTDSQKDISKEVLHV